jgi:hypothetical protein
MANDNKPAYIRWHVKPTNKKDSEGNSLGIWTRIGVLWPTKSGNGFSEQSEYLPLTEGSIYVLPYKEKDEKEKPHERPIEEKA